MGGQRIGVDRKVAALRRRIATGRCVLLLVRRHSIPDSASSAIGDLDWPPSNRPPVFPCAADILWLATAATFGEEG